ncbi:MAG: RHS repeat protein [Acidobacteria bacterium]|nr:RHS repeat protein [Acidobacteriota bacterium]
MRSILASILAFSFAGAALLAQTLPGFGTFSPDRGFMAYGSYSVSDTENINEANGGLTLRYPLASLPPGRGGFTHGIGLVYNSQIFDLTTEAATPIYAYGNTYCDPSPCPQKINVLTRHKLQGGWQYSFSYVLEEETRPGDVPCTSTNELGWAMKKYTLTLPDGSSHTLRMIGSKDYYGDGYYRHDFNGTKACPLAPGGPIDSPVSFYTTDGSFIQVVKNSSSWTATFPDGKRVSGSSHRASQICGRNDNCVSIQNSLDPADGDKPITEVVDAIGRRIRIKYNIDACLDPPNCTSSSDQIFAPGYGGTGSDPTASPAYQWNVIWTNSSVGSSGDALNYFCNSPTEPLPEGTPYTCKMVSTVRNVQQIVLPTGAGALKYEFLYADDSAPAGMKGWGEIREVRLPNASPGADYRPRVEYLWKLRPTGLFRDAQRDAENSIISKSLFRREELAGTSMNVPTETWTYTFPRGASLTGTITGPDGGTTTNHFIMSNDLGRHDLVWKTVSHAGGIIEKHWERNEPWLGTPANADRRNIYVRAEFRKPPGANQYSAVVFELDKNGNTKKQTEYDFGVQFGRDTLGVPNSAPTSGTVLRTALYDYYFETQPAAMLPPLDYEQTDANAYWRNYGLRVKGAKKRTTVKGASGIEESATDFFYDSPGTTANLTSEAKWDNSNGAVLPPAGGLSRLAGNAEVTDYTWTAGNLTGSTGPDNDVTILTYGELAGCPSNHTNLYPTQVVQHSGPGGLPATFEFQYDCATGLLKKLVKEPGLSAKAITVTGAYDLYGRPTGQVTAAGVGGSTLLRQAGTEYNDTARWVRQTASLDGPSDMRLAAVFHFDGMGQLTRDRRTDDSGGAVSASSTNGVVSERFARYVASEGRYELESSTYKPSPEAAVTQPPRAWARKLFDRDGRLVESKTFKGDALPPPWGANGNVASSTTYSYSGASTTITDAAEKQRTETRDGLGRQKSVSDGGLVQAIYEYDSRDQVTQVTQTDSANYGSTFTQIRTFSYTSLGRLESASNPESGIARYKYYPGGALKERKDARNVTVTLTYDGAQRVKTWTYSDGTPGVLYCYDGEVYDSGSCQALSGRSSDGADYPKGRLTGIGTTVAWTNHEQIDGLGRTLRVKQGVAGLGEKVLTYGYAANDAVKQIGYPSGRMVTYALSDAGRATQVTGLLGGQTTQYVSEAKYSASGMPLSWKLSGGLVKETRSYNWLGQMTGMEALRNTDLLLRLTFDYPAFGNNGNLLGQTVETGTRTFRQYYGYDGANRLRLAMERGSNGWDLSTATCGGIQGTWAGGEWCVRYGHDGFGNAWSPEHPGAGGLAANGPSWYLHTDNGTYVNNRFKDVGYDPAGNQTQVQVNNAQRVGDYDGDSRLICVRDTVPETTTVAENFYDGEGRRVKRTVSGLTTYYVYGLDGAVAAEYQTPLQAGSVGPKYVLTDHLGSTRMLISGDGTPVVRRDYEPFGMEIARSGEGYGAADSTAWRFTGKERDGETGLDYFGARYFSGAQGRFTSPDLLMASGRTGVAQSWNRYAYVLNNPLSYVDPTGMQEVPTSCGVGNLDCLQAESQAIANAFNADTGIGILKGVANSAISANATVSPGLGLLFMALGSPQFQATNTNQQIGMFLAAATEAAFGIVAGGATTNTTTTTVFRVEGAANTRLGIGPNGSVSIEGSNMLFLNFGQEGRAQQFLQHRVAQGTDAAQIKSFEVPTSFLQDLRKSAVPESLARQNPNAPIRVDATKAPDQFGLRPAQIEALRKVIVPGSGRTY